VDAVLVLPNQLFRDHPHASEAAPVYLVEEDAYFTRFRFHKKKLVLHRASMKAYQARLAERGIDVRYVENASDTLDVLYQKFLEDGVDNVICTEILDHGLERRVDGLSARHGVRVRQSRSPGFLTPRSWLEKFFSGKKRALMRDFYVAQRRRMNLLLEDGKPVGGKWSLDALNRKRLPHDAQVPEMYEPAQNEHLREAVKYVRRGFGGNPGTTSGFQYPVTHEQADELLADFLENRLELFGSYQDAIVRGESRLYHSLLSSSLNTGLLSPDRVLDATLRHAETHKVPLNSLEGFVRQLAGWREYVRGVYLWRGREMAESNLWGHEGSLAPSFYRGETGIPPVDDAVRKVTENAYANHIERLMVLGNYMLLTGTDPREAYWWFMEMFIDAYDWVMVPNLHGMSQYSDGGTMTTKPYIGGSNYILRMSDYQRGGWADTWDELFWGFVEKNVETLREIPRMGLILYNLERRNKK
jgi:deoxyribodipyrimidine photolyase-related protein